MKILLVEDDPLLAQGLATSLKRDGFVVNHVPNGKMAISAMLIPDHDIMILDLGLPDIDGFEVLKQVRKKLKNFPILILTARDEIAQKVTGLDLGADDYLVKPFNTDELLARLRVFERRLGTANSSLITINKVTLDLAAQKVLVDNQSIVLSKKELMILKSLMEQAGRIQSKEQLENKLYEWGEEVASNTIEVHVHHLRKKLPKHFITTVRGVGYTVDLT